MSAREWKPGDVALVQKGGGDWHPAMRNSDGDGWVCYHGVECEAEAIRPLVVIDPQAVAGPVGAPSSAEGARYIARLLREADENNGIPTFGRLADAFDPKPRIEEPTGLGAVVELVGGGVLVRTPAPIHDLAVWADMSGDFYPWSALDVAKVLHEGWSE